MAGGCASASIDEPNDGLVEREPSEDAKSEVSEQVAGEQVEDERGG